MILEGEFRGELLEVGFPRWSWELDDEGELVEPLQSVFSWQRKFRAHGRHVFGRRNTASTGLAVGLLISTYVTYDQDRGDFASTTVSVSRLATELNLKRDSVAVYLEEGMAGGWWLLEDRGRGSSKLISLSLPLTPWWNLAETGPELEPVSIPTPRNELGQYTEPAPAGGATPPPEPAPLDGAGHPREVAPLDGAGSDELQTINDADLPHSAGTPTCPTNGEGPAQRTVDTCPTERGTTYKTYEKKPTQITNGSTIDIADQRVDVRILNGPNAGAFTSLPKSSADELIAQGKAIAA